MADISFERRGSLGLITLDRPKALNALTPGMVGEMQDNLDAWATDDTVHAVLITGAGSRAFCAGGDVKDMALQVKSGNTALARDFFRAEYTLNYTIHKFPKPYIAWLDGIAMGGGVGVSAHGSHRVATENTLFAMPETSIGFFPDIGGGYFLPRFPGQTGTYLALTSSHIGPADSIYTGFATHYMPSYGFDTLVETLSTQEWGGGDDKETVTQVLDSLSVPTEGDAVLAPHRAQIDGCFGHDTVEGIFESLNRDDSAFAAETLAALYAVCPVSLKVALRQLREGEKLDFARVMQMEYRISQRRVLDPNFYEGVRAALIDKDKKPQWVPRDVSDVDEETVSAHFADLGEQELKL